MTCQGPVTALSDSGQFTPVGYLSTVIHTTLASIESTTF